MQNKMIETVKEDVSKLGRLEPDQDNTVLVGKQIGKTTYLVRVHFSKTSKETMQDKISRMLREDVKHMAV